MSKRLQILVLSLCAISSAGNAFATNKFIYGSDDRIEAGLSTFSDFIPVVAAKVPDQKTNTISLREQYNLCPDESQCFADQQVLSTCSGVLIAPNLLLTAGHCMVTSEDCKNFKWAFGWTYEQDTPRELARCEKVLAQQWYPGSDSKLDYALVKLSEAPKVRNYPSLRRRWHARVGTELVMLGHPLGLPMKVSTNGKVTLLDRNNNGIISGPLDIIRRTFKRAPYFSTNLDSFAGNSSSPVFNAKSGLLEGILIAGGADFEWDQKRGCKRYIRDGKRPIAAEEKVLRTSVIPDIWEYIEKALD